MDLELGQLYYSARFDRALQFSAQCHDRQYRKGTRVPYWSHPVAVAFLLRSYGYGENIQISGLLHDVVEDTECTFDDIHQEFGSQVAEIVNWCTELPQGRPWEERKAAMIQKLRGAPDSAKAVASADKAHNLNTIMDTWEIQGVEVWSRFSRGPLQQLKYYQQMLNSISVGFSEPILNELKAALLRFEDKMKPE